jgi:hypothetical protein
VDFLKMYKAFLAGSSQRMKLFWEKTRTNQAFYNFTQVKLLPGSLTNDLCPGQATGAVKDAHPLHTRGYVGQTFAAHSVLQELSYSK